MDWDKELDEEAERQKKRKKEKTVQATVKKPIAETTVPALPKPNSSPKASRTKSDSTSKSSAVDLLGLSKLLLKLIIFVYNFFLIYRVFTDSPTSVPSTVPTAKANNADDVFSNFLSAPPATASPRHDANQTSTLR